MQSVLNCAAVVFSQPTPDTDLISTYTLKNLQHSVARFDPVTGEKFNGLKKSYRSKLKGLEGRNQATKSQAELWGFVNPEWDQPRGDGQDLWMEHKGKLMLDQSDLDGIMGVLDDALGGMQQGHLPHPQHENWKKTLGLDDANQAANGPVKPLPNALNAPKVGAQNPLLSKTSAATAMRSSAPASPRNANGAGIAARPDRTGKKRRYDESSYEGYDDDGYDSERRGSAGKRQKRKVSGRRAGFYSQIMDVDDVSR